MDKPNQRVGSVSNAHVGADFKRVAMEYFAKKGIIRSRNFSLDVGLLAKKNTALTLGRLFQTVFSNPANLVSLSGGDQ
jgi:hypothetical protein